MQDPQLATPFSDRIREHTAPDVNRKIDQQTRGAIAEASRTPGARRARLAELDREWTVDSALMLNFGIVGAISAFKAMSNLRATGRAGGWGVFFWVQLGFLVNHAIRGWCPPLPVFRRLGFRSAQEIGAERVALSGGAADEWQLR